MSNVITLNAPLTRPARSSVGLDRGASAATGLLHALATLVARGRDAAALRGLSDHALSDIGLTRRDLGRGAVSGTWDAATGSWTPPGTGL